MHTDRRPNLASAFLPEVVGPAVQARDGRWVVGRQEGQEGWWLTLGGGCVCPEGGPGCRHERLVREALAKPELDRSKSHLLAKRLGAMQGRVAEIVSRMAHGKASHCLASSGIVSWAITHPEAGVAEWRRLATVGIGRVGRMLLRHPQAGEDLIVRESLWKLAEERLSLFEGQLGEDRFWTVQLWTALIAKSADQEALRVWLAITGKPYEFYVPVAAALAKRAAMEDNRELIGLVLQSPVRIVREEAIRHMNPKGLRAPKTLKI